MPVLAETPCAPIPGLDAVLTSPAHIIWFGEIHGTAESPAFFGNVVCAAGRGHPVVVALERLPEEDRQTQAFLAVPDKDEATSVLLSGPQWRSRLQDGRSSAAMLALMQRLREYKAAGLVADVVLIDDWSRGGDDKRDAAMADIVKASLAKHPGARILVYSGNAHGKKGGPPQHAAGHLPEDDVYSVNIQIENGTSWSVERGVGPALGFPHRPTGIVRVADSGLPSVATGGYDAIAFLGVPVTASRPVLEEALALTAPVHDALAKVDADQEALAPPASDRERLERMFDVDQAGRQAAQDIDVAQLPKVQQAAAQTMMWEDEINWRDRRNQKELKAMMPATGWFTRSKYGKRASDAAFLIVQHAVNDPDLMRDGLKRMTPFVGTGEIDDQQYALLYDRISLQFDYKPQRYGSQVVCRAGTWQPDTLEDPDHVDERRKAVGMRQTEAEYLKYFEKMPCH
jgi:hypothetical protein